MARPRNPRRPDSNPVGSSDTLVQVPSRNEEKVPRSGVADLAYRTASWGLRELTLKAPGFKVGRSRQRRGD